MEEGEGGMDGGEAEGGVVVVVGDELDADVGEGGERDQQGIRRREAVALVGWAWRVGDCRVVEAAGRVVWRWPISFCS